MDFKTKYKSWVDLVNNALDEFIVEKDGYPAKTIYSAMKYSLTAGGKRLRPVLALAVGEMLGGKPEGILPFACAIEMIHTYSLIHDDLPAMDNDDYRRGRLTNHKVFGEAKAILAGDALLNLAFETMLNHTVSNTQNILSKTKAMAFIAKASGVSGMIGGQVIDIESEGKDISAELLEYMHKCKTGALIKAPVMAAALVCNANAENIKNLELYAERIGLAFQIKDDILDVEGNTEVLGKKTGSDEANHKATFVTVYGLEGSKQMLEKITNEAIECISKFGDRAEFLVELAKYLIIREN